jgi:hypothetical protein
VFPSDEKREPGMGKAKRPQEWWKTKSADEDLPEPSLPLKAMSIFEMEKDEPGRYHETIDGYFGRQEKGEPSKGKRTRIGKDKDR